MFVNSGQSVENVNFGNRPIPEPAILSGTKWVDENGDGERGPDEPGLAGVVIYADLNWNGVRDRNEPATETRFDDPDEPGDQTGDWTLTVRPGNFPIREVVPRGYRQTSPAAGATIIDVYSERTGEQTAAISFSLIDAVRFDGVDPDFGSTVALTFEAEWANGCFGFADEYDVHTDGESFLFAEMFGQETGGVCTQATQVQQRTVEIPGVAGDFLIVEGALSEYFADGVVHSTHRLQGFVQFANTGYHEVNLVSGDRVSGLDFGNAPLDDDIVAPEEPFADINQDGDLGADDIDALAAAIRRESTSPAHDFSRDGLVDHSDLEYLVEDLMGSRFGDSNMDGLFDSTDLVRVFQAGKYEDGIDGNATWQEGDWDGDGDFTSSDLVFVFQHGAYEQGPVAASPVTASDADDVWSLVRSR